MDVAQFVTTQLSRITPKNITKTSIFICCPFHREKSPSFGINIDPSNRKVPIGFGHCFGCSEKASWNKLAEQLGLELIPGMRKDGTLPLKYAQPINKNTANLLLNNSPSLTIDQLEDSLGCILGEPIDKDEEWRTFSGAFLLKIGCRVAVDNYDNKSLIMPVIIDGEIVGGQKALWKKPKNKKILAYVNMPGDWIVTKGLFPYDYALYLMKKKGKSYVVLVEGARDALRLLSLGIPALAILGSKNWSDAKRTLVLDLPIDTVVVMMDADRAGIQASNTIMKSLKSHTTRQLIKMTEWQRKYEAKKGELGYNIDPGACPPSLLKRIIQEFDPEFS